MSLELRQRLYGELSSLEILDPHTHIHALDPASHTLADILGYHYYTELAHSSGMPRQDIEEPGLDPKEKVGRLIENMAPIDNTIQSSWFVDMAQSFFAQSTLCEEDLGTFRAHDTRFMAIFRCFLIRT